ncbi:hypothetical protein MP228_004967 [Amoeboaphelidium protococcarum]|nr:hypothetical protein MP228_004967 [Amoeboaphelidium protococcarum]
MPEDNLIMPEEEENVDKSRVHEFDGALDRMASTSSLKAGLEGVDKNHVKKVIYEMSRDSKFYQNEQKKDQQTQDKIDAIQKKYDQLKQTDMTRVQKIIDKQIALLEQESRDLSRIIVHLDMDAFFAAVEERDNPSLRGKPVGVGGIGMLSTANYEARRFGVRSAMPGFIAKQLCPQLIIVPTRFSAYKEASLAVQEVLKQYDPNLEMLSLDEGYMDLTPHLTSNGIDIHSHHLILEVVKEMRMKVQEKTKLTCSAGIGANRMIAKICTDFNKPNGQHLIPNQVQDILEFMKPLNIRKISGIGKVTERILNSIGINTCEELYQMRMYTHELFSKITFDFLLRISLGIGSNVVGGSDDDSDRKSVSVERTFNAMSDREALLAKLREISQKLNQDLEKKNLSGKCVTLKIKMSDFSVKSKAKSVLESIQSADDIYSVAKSLLLEVMPCELRLMGLRMSSLNDPTNTESSGRKQLGIKSFLQCQQQMQDEEQKQQQHSSRKRPSEHLDEFKCPICQQHILEAAVSNDNIMLNRHIDECLNLVAINEMQQSDKNSNVQS